MGNRFKVCRTDRKLTQDEVAKLLGCTRAAYGHYENGRRDMPLDMLLHLSDYYGCSTDELLGSSYYYELVKMDGE